MNIKKHLLPLPVFVSCRNSRRLQQGYVALITVLIVGMAGAAIAVSVLLRGISMTKNSIIISQSVQAKAYADTCAEEALERVRKNSTYTGTAAINFSSDSCSYTVTNTGGTARQIDSTGTVNTLVRDVQVLLTDVDPITVSDWQEVTN